MNYSSRFFLYAPFVTLCALFAATALWWQNSASAWSKKLDALNGHEIMPGIRMTFASKSVGGFPFRIDTEFRKFTLAADGPRGLTWRSDAFAMHGLLYGDTRAVFESGGIQTLSWKREDGSGGKFSFLPGSIRASAVANGGRLLRFDFVMVALDSTSLDIAHGEAHLRRSPSTDALDLIVSADGIRQDGKTSESILVNARIEPRKPLEQLLRGEADWRAGFDAWCVSGGKIISVQQPTKELAALNPQHRLIGNLAGRTIATAPLY